MCCAMSLRVASESRPAGGPGSSYGQRQCAYLRGSTRAAHRCSSRGSTSVTTSMYSACMSTSERLIESTRELLWERGYVGTSPKAILERAGAGQGSMYHHFK